MLSQGVRAIAIIVTLSAVAACGNPDGAHPATAASPPPELTDVPRAPDRAAVISGDMRTLEPFTGDLDALLDRGVVRVLVVPSRTHFQVVNGMQRGRTVDAAVALEQFLNERLAPGRVTVILIPSAETSLIPDLLAGQADIATNVRRTFERDDQVAFANAVRTGVREIVVTGPGEPPLVSLEDVGGRTIHVRKDSDHHMSAVRLNEQLKKIDRPGAKIVTVDDSVTDEDLLERVNDGRIEATLADDYVFDAWKATFARTTTNRDVAVSQDGVIAWVTRKESAKLLELVNEFFASHRLTF